MRRRSNIIAVSVFLTATLLVFLISPRNRQRLQSGFLSVISPFLRKGSELDATWKNYDKGVKKLGELEAENLRLKTEAAQLRAENHALRGVEEENLRLQKALGYQTQSPFTLMPARVIGRPAANWWSALLVDKGAADGVSEGACVLTAEGLVGRVIQASARVSTVLLVTDENCKVAARVGDSKQATKQGILRVDLRGEMRGDRVLNTTQPQLILTFIGKYESLAKGQEIFTSGVDQVYPPGVLIGRVVDSKARELYKQAVIEPAVALAGLSDVFIVAGMKGAQAQK
jgi:rod shape-determining protein MreC